ncbi:PKD domain-containing protein [bacterium]|nr:PKD domain-containing protein [bacterium]
MADYSKDAWVWSGPFSETAQAELDSALHRSGSGSCYFAVAAPAGASALVSGLDLTLISPDNNPPLPLIDPPSQTGDAPFEALLDASLSADPDPGDSILLFEWDFESDGTFDLSGASDAVATPTYTNPGAYTVTLRLTDTRGATATTTASVNVTAAGNNPPSASFTADPLLGAVPVTVNFDASGSDAGGDLGDSITSYEWDFDGDGAFDEAGPSASTSHEYRAAGRMEAVLRVTDSASNQGTAALSIDLSPQVVEVAQEPVFALDLAEVDGRPALTYLTYDPGSFPTVFSVKFALADTTAGYVWNSPVTVQENVGNHDSLSLGLVGSNPAVCYKALDGSLAYIRAIDGQGMSWGAPVTVDPAQSDVREFSLAMVLGRPAVSYRAFSPGLVRLFYVRAADAQGMAWGAAQMLNDQNNSSGWDSKLMMVNGRPGISFWYENNDGNAQISFMRASDAIGTAWQAPVTIATGDYGNAFPAMTKVLGRPVVCFSSDSGALMFASAQDDNGSAWNSPDLVNMPAQPYKHLTMSFGAPGLFVFAQGYPAQDVQAFSPLSPDGSLWDAPLIVDSTAGSGFQSVSASINSEIGLSYWNDQSGKLYYLTTAPVPNF